VSYTVPHIRRTEDTAYIRSYGLGQPYGIRMRTRYKWSIYTFVPYNSVKNNRPYNNRTFVYKNKYGRMCAVRISTPCIYLPMYVYLYGSGQP